MQNMATWLMGTFGVALGSMIGIGVLVPVVGKAITWIGNPHRIADLHYRRLAKRMWGAMAGAGQFVWSWLLLGLGGVCACAALMFGMRLRSLLAQESHKRRVQQEAALS